MNPLCDPLPEGDGFYLRAAVALALAVRLDVGRPAGAPEWHPQCWWTDVRPMGWTCVAPFGIADLVDDQPRITPGWAARMERAARSTVAGDAPDLVAAIRARELQLKVDAAVSGTWRGDPTSTYAPAIEQVRRDERLRWLLTRWVAMLTGWELSAPGRRVPPGVPPVSAPR
jgi:hypothetical protein